MTFNRVSRPYRPVLRPECHKIEQAEAEDYLFDRDAMEPNNNNNNNLPQEQNPCLTLDTLHLNGHLHSCKEEQRGQQHADDEEMFQDLCHSLLRNDAGGVGEPVSNTWVSSSSSSASHSDGSAEAAARDNSATLPSPVIQTKEGSPPNPSPGPSSKPKPKQKAEEGSGAKKSQRMIRIRLAEAEQAVQGLTQRFSRAQAENIRLKSLDKTLSADLYQAEFQHRLTEVLNYGPRNPLLLSGSSSQVSFSELPPASCWDASWVSRIQQLGPREFMVLRRQWTQQSALLLPQALTYGPGSAAYQKLEWLNDKNTDLARAVLTLSPSVWLESSQYDMETLGPIPIPSAEWMRDLLLRIVRPQALGGLIACATEYHATTSALHAEYTQLMERYNFLAAAANMQPLKVQGADAAGSSRAFSGPLFGSDSPHCLLRLDCPPQYVHVLEQMDQVAKLLQANTSKHRAALLKYFSKFHHDFHPNRINFSLMTYPMASTAVDFLPAMLLLKDSASSSPPDQAQPQAPGPMRLN